MSLRSRVFGLFSNKTPNTDARAKRKRARHQRRRTLLLEGLEQRQLLAAFTPGNLAVYRVGDGASPLANTGNAVFVDEYTPSGTLVQSIAMPTTGDVKLIASGQVASEGMLTLSPDGTQLALTGYNSTFLASGTLAGATATTLNRSVAVVDTQANASLYSFSGNFSSAGIIRSAVVDGNMLYATGEKNGLRYVDLSALTPNSINNSSTAITTTSTDLNALTIVDSQLFVSAPSGTSRLFRAGASLPTSGSPTLTTLSLSGLTTPSQFFLADLNSEVGINAASSTKGIDTVYVTETGASFGLAKYTFNGTSWANSGSIGIQADQYRGLTGIVNGGTVTLYAVRKGGSSAAGGGELVSVVDASGYNGAFAGTPTLLASALTGGANNTAFRGVAFVPSSGAAPAEVDVQGNGQSIADGDTTPSADDHTLFGSTPVGQNISRTFTIHNTGGSELTLSDPASSDAQFVIQNFPAGPIAPGGSATFDVIFTPASAATVTAAISFENNDSDEATYNFDVAGTGEANQPPAFISSGPYNVNENSAAGTVVGTVTASDPDAGQSLTFSEIGTGSGASLFEIDDSGVISVSDGAVLDLEATSSYTFGVRVTDNGSPAEHADVTVTINLSNVNEAPIFPAGPITRQILAGSANDDAVVGGAVTATDPDAGDSVVDYAIVGGNGTGAGAFAISTSGVITVNDAAQTLAVGSFSLQITAHDSFGLASDPKTVTVQVVNDAPVFDPDVYGSSVTELDPNGTLVGDPVSATDPNAGIGDFITFSIVAGNGTGSGAFAIDPVTGQLSVNDSSQMDHEVVSSYTLTIRATDRAGAFDTATFNVVIFNTPESPVIPAGQEFTIVENAANGVMVGTVQATFDVVTSPENRRFNLTGGNGDAPGAFAISNSGVITVNDSSQIDYEALVNHQFVLTVTASDAIFTQFTTSQTVIVKLTNIHEGTHLAPGDLLITGINGDNDDEFSFAPLVDLAPNTEIRFTDKGWLAAGGFRSGEGVIVYVAPAGGILAGTELGITKNGSTNAVSLSHGDGSVFDETGGALMEISIDGDSITAFQGTVETPTPLYAVTLQRHVFNADASDENTTALPSGLTLGVHAVAVGLSGAEVDNAEYTGQMIGSADLFRSTVSNAANWSKSDSRINFTFQNFTFNTAPTDINLSNNSVSENLPAGAQVGLLTSVDGDSGDTFVYTLVPGEGSTDNDSFDVDGDWLTTAASFDFEVKDSYTIRIRTTDAAGFFFEKEFTINVTNENEAPTGIDLSNSALAENEPVETVIGGFNTTDPDAGESFTYILVDGDGSADNASFTIVNGELRTAESFNFELKDSYTIRVRSTDEGDLFTEQSFVISIANVNEAPTAIIPSDTSIVEEEPIGTAVASFSTTDEDLGDTFTYTLVNGDGDGDNASFTFDGNALKSAEIFDYQTKNSYQIRVRSTDAEGLFTEQTFVIGISDVRINGFPGTTPTYKENADPLVIGGVGLVQDIQLLDFDGGALSVWLSNNGTADDRLAIKDSPIARNKVSLAGNVISYSKLVSDVLQTYEIGSYTGGNGLDPLVITFNANAFKNEVQAVLKVLTFAVDSENPSTALREVSFQLTDGDGGTSNTTTRSINVVSVIDNPVVTVTNTVVEYLEAGAAVLIDEGITVSDLDSPDFDGGRLIVKAASGGKSSDRYTILPSAWVSVVGSAVSYDGTQIGTITTDTSTFIVTFDADADAQKVQEVARRIAFFNPSENLTPPETDRVISFQLTDGDGGTSAAALGDLVKVVALNNAPVLSVTDTTPAKYTEDAAPSLIATSGTVVDVDLWDFDGGVLTVSIASNGELADRLTVMNVGVAANQISVDQDNNIIFNAQIIGNFTGGMGSNDPLEITFNEFALKAAVQATFRAITFSHVSDNPSTAQRLVSFSLTDGDGGTSNVVTRRIDVVAKNDAPTVFNFGDPVEYALNGPPVHITSSPEISDFDSNNFDAGKLVVSLTAGKSSADRIEIQEGDLITVVGNTVFYDGDEIGTFAGTTTLTITFTTQDATAAAAEALLRRISFRSTASSTSQRTVSVTLHDGDGAKSAVVAKQINVTNGIV
jgi:hypothetical protein